MVYQKSLQFLVAAAFLLLMAGFALSTTNAAPASTNSYLGPEIIISAIDSEQFVPDIAYNSKHDEYLVVWENMWGIGGHHDVYAQRVSATGRLLSWFAVTDNNHKNKQMNPSVAYDPVYDRYLVVYAYDVYGTGGDWDIYGRFIPWNGPDPNVGDFMICNWTTNQMRPVVAYGYAQGEFLVTWTNAPAGQPTYISARRVFADGSTPFNPFTVASGTDDRDYQDVTYNLHRNEYLVTYDLDKDEANLDIYGVRLRGDGIPLTGGNPNVMGEFPIAGWPDDEERPAVEACDKADQYLVAWQSDQGTGGTDYAIYAYYLNGDAVPVYVTMISDTTLPQVSVDVACNNAGKGYMITWQDKYVGGEYGIWARLAQPELTLGPEFEVVGPRQASDREYPAVAGGGNNFLIAWEHDRDGGGNRDIHGRLLGYVMYLPLVSKQ